ncbi:hypothetical protein U9144_05085, partial [Escherichia coli]|uniref:hypothetical protein n=1 Tax=Escherichia coli TaxID=562 RepID=UPI0019D64F0A
WKGWAILLRQKQKKLIMLPSETMIWQPEFTDKTLSRKPGAVQSNIPYHQNSSSLPKKNVQKIIHGKLSGALTILMDC